MKRNRNTRRSNKQDAHVFNQKFQDEREARIVEIKPKNESQQIFKSILEDNVLAVANGWAGTGKTFLAATHAANKLLTMQGHTIYLTRPYVPMGRSVGLLPGTAEEKMAPFLAPLTSVIKRQVGDAKYKADFGTRIKVILLESIRGLDLNNATLICDEMQNATIEEIKSVITRIGDNAQVVIIGDTNQSDIKKKDSGLDWLCDMIEKHDVRDADFVEFGVDDIVRSGHVKQWIKIFNKEGV